MRIVHNFELAYGGILHQLVDKVIYCEYEELENVIFSFNERFGLCVNFNNVKYEFLLNLKENCDKLIVFGPSAYPITEPRDEFRPRFDRWSWNFKYSTIHYNDPTSYLSKDMRAGWGIGTNDDWYLEKISKIISIISNKLNVLNKDILFFGSSQGGFMSIALSILIKDSKALADIPQLDVHKYWPIHWKYLKEYSFLEDDDSVIFKDYGYRVKIIDLIKREEYIPKIILILDFSVLIDVESQYIPFLKQLKNLAFNYHDFIKIIIGNKNQGHTPLYKDYIIPIIYYVLEYDMNDSLPSHNNITKQNWIDLKMNDNEQFQSIDNDLWKPDENVHISLNNEVLSFYHECGNEFKGIKFPYNLPKSFSIKFKLNYTCLANIFIDSNIIVTFRNDYLNNDSQLSVNEWHDIEIIRNNTEIFIKGDGEVLKFNESNGNLFYIKVFGSNNRVSIKNVCFKLGN